MTFRKGSYQGCVGSPLQARVSIVLVGKAHKGRSTTAPRVLVLDDEGVLQLAEGGKDSFQLVLLRGKRHVAKGAR